MFKSINSKFYSVSILLVFLFIFGYVILLFFLHQQNQSVTLVKDAVNLERNISTLNTYFYEVRLWEQVILAKNSPEANVRFAYLLGKIRTNLTAVMNSHELDPAYKTKLSQVTQDIHLYEASFNQLIQLKTRQSIQSTRMDTNFRSIVSIILYNNHTLLLRPLFNFSHFLASYRSAKDSPKYQALRLVIESLEKKLKPLSEIDPRMLDYLESFSNLLDKNYEMELDISVINRKVESITSKLQNHFTDISSESKQLINQKLQEAGDISNEMQQILLYSSLLGALFLLLILRHISQSIIVPIKSMSHVVQAVKDGDIMARFKGHSKNQDEIIQLGLSFNDMLDTLQKNNMRLLDYQQELKDKISELSRRETERKKLTARIRRIEKMEAIGTLAGGVAHDLNNILSGVVSYPDLILLDLPQDSPYREPILTIQESGKKAAEIVQDLLTLARRGVAITNVTNLNFLISEYLASPEFNKLKSLHLNVEFKIDLAPDLLNIKGSPVHLTKSIMNLLSNGAESILSSGVVSIQTYNRYLSEPIKGYDEIMEGDYVILIVSDTGIGIHSANIDRIFEPFFTKKEMGRSGTGLGLTVVWGTVQDHNGYIDIQSIEGQGTTFTLYFPATRQPLPEDAASSLSIEAYMGKGESILVVDDIENQRKIATEMLEKIGYTVNSVESGEQAIAYLQHNSADLLILDMIMPPGIDGLETYKRILEVNPNQKAIISSGYSETDRVKEAQKAGASTYIKKPYTLEKIGLAVKNELNRTGS